MADWQSFFILKIEGLPLTYLHAPESESAENLGPDNWVQRYSCTLYTVHKGHLHY